MDLDTIGIWMEEKGGKIGEHQSHESNHVEESERRETQSVLATTPHHHLAPDILHYMYDSVRSSGFREQGPGEIANARGQIENRHWREQQTNA